MQSIRFDHRRGIDVSNNNGQIDWNQVVVWFNSHRNVLPWAMIKATQGNYFVDKFCENNYLECKRLGIPVGPYHFADWGNVDEEVNLFLHALNGYDFDLPWVLDAERSGNLPDESWTKQEATDWMIHFLETVKATGKRVAVYASTSFIKQYFDERMKNYLIWVADYNSAYTPGENGIYDHWDAYQYTSKGQIDGIDGYVDLNVCEPNWLESTPVTVPKPEPVINPSTKEFPLSVEDANYIVDRWIGHEYDLANAEDQNNRHRLANELRKASGQPLT